MVIKKTIAQTLIIFFILVACVSGNTQTEEVVIPTNTLAIPSYTFTPTQTSTSTPTIIIPTPTIYLSPFPTLSGAEAFEKLYKSEFECDTPCWWGIIPGVSTWTETEQFINQFHTSMYEYDGDTNYKITKSAFSDIYIWYVINPILNTDYYASIHFEVQNNIVTAIKVGEELIWYFFPIHKLFEEYGKPNKILVEIEESSATHNFAIIYVLYEDKHILANYSFSSLKTNDSLNMCLLDYYSEGQMVLWAPNTDLNFDFSKLKPLEKFSELNVETFYEKFKEENSKCFGLSKSAWD